MKITLLYFLYNPLAYPPIIITSLFRAFNWNWRYTGTHFHSAHSRLFAVPSSSPCPHFTLHSTQTSQTARSHYFLVCCTHKLHANDNSLRTHSPTHSVASHHESLALSEYYTIITYTRYSLPLKCAVTLHHLHANQHPCPTS